MSEKYEPGQEDYIRAKEMLTPEEAQMSKDRQEVFRQIEDGDALKHSELSIQISEDGDIAKVVGRVRDHSIRMMCIGMQQKNGKYVVEIDGYPPVEEQELAKDLFRKYYNIALAQKI
jgi:hypothetical protein